MNSAYIDADDEVPEADDLALSTVTVPDGAPSESGTRAVIYLRVSTPGQTKNDYDPEGISIPAQRKACQRKAEQLGLTIVDEYVKPGRTATEMTKRVKFQEMLTRVRNDRDVDVIIVYKLSRMARNRFDDAIVMADLRQRGVSLISATEAIDDTPTGQLMHGILASVNEYQSRESGADIAYKMGQKARSGGTIGRAPLGYLNVRESIDSREIRTVIIDPERGPLVRLAFELYATGEWTLADLSDELFERGLRTKPTAKHPAQAVSISKLSEMLRDRYYLGYVEYKGEEIKGRHEPLIAEELFERVQEVIETRAAAGEYRRVHHHYLKGSLLCGRCHRAGLQKRMIFQRSVNPRGTVYHYFFCINKQGRGCATPHVNVALIEDAVEKHYDRIRFAPGFIAEVRAHLAQTLESEQAAVQLLHKQLKAELRALDTREDNLIDLAADGGLPQGKIKAKLREIERQRERLTERLGKTSDDLSEAAKLIQVCLKLLETPRALYERCDEHQRRLLNQAIFHGLYVEDDGVTEGVLQEPFARLHALHEARSGAEPAKEGVTAEDGSAPTTEAQNATRASLPKKRGPGGTDTMAVLLGGLDSAVCSSPNSMVELWGFEPQTSSMPWRRATNCAIAPPLRGRSSRSAPPVYRTPGGGLESFQAPLSVRSSLSTGSGRVPALCSARRQPPSRISLRTDQQQLDRPPSRSQCSSGRPRRYAMPRRRAAPWAATTSRPSGGRSSRARSRAVPTRFATWRLVSPPGGCQAACSAG
jgi:site-specific DNA recombinase